MINELDKLAKMGIYFCPLLLTFVSWIWQYGLERHYGWKGSIQITAIVSLTTFFVTNSFVCLWIVGVESLIIILLIIIVSLSMVFIALTFMDEAMAEKTHDFILVVIILSISLVYLFQSYVVWTNL